MQLDAFGCVRSRLGTSEVLGFLDFPGDFDDFGRSLPWAVIFIDIFGIGARLLGWLTSQTQ